MQLRSWLHYDFYKFNTKYPLEVIYFFNTSSDEVNYIYYSGFHIYTTSQLYRLYSENTIVFPTYAYIEQSSVFLNNLGFLQRTDKVIVPVKNSLEVWQGIQLIFVGCCQSFTEFFKKHLRLSGYDATYNYSNTLESYKIHFNSLTKALLFSYKIVATLEYSLIKSYNNNLLFISPVINYINNFYTGQEITKLSRFMALCYDKAKLQL